MNLQDYYDKVKAGELPPPYDPPQKARRPHRFPTEEALGRPQTHRGRITGPRQSLVGIPAVTPASPLVFQKTRAGQCAALMDLQWSLVAQTRPEDLWGRIRVVAALASGCHPEDVRIGNQRLVPRYATSLAGYLFYLHEGKAEMIAKGYRSDTAQKIINRLSANRRRDAVFEKTVDDLMDILEQGVLI